MTVWSKVHPLRNISDNTVKVIENAPYICFLLGMELFRIPVLRAHTALQQYDKHGERL